MYEAPPKKTTPVTITTLVLFELVKIDFLTDSSSPSGFCYALVYVGHVTKFAVVVLTEDQTASTMGKLFWKHVV